MEYFNGFIYPFLSAMASALVVYLVAFPKNVRERNKKDDLRLTALEQGIRAVLKDKIQKEYLIICADYRKFAKPYEKENVSNLYDAYVALGGNGYIKKLYEQIMAKPINPEDIHNPK